MFPLPSRPLFSQVSAEQQHGPEIDEDALLDLNEPTNASQDDGMEGADAGQRAEVDNAQFAAGNHLADLVLEVEGKELHVNRAVLAQFSPAFERMFFADGFKEKDQSRISLPGKSYATFTTFLQLMYPQSPNAAELISDENLGQMLGLADEYQSDHVKVRCLEYMRSQLFEYYRSCKAPFPIGQELMVSRTMLYFWMCDQYRLQQFQETVSIFKENVTGLQSMKNSAHYNSMSDSSKVKLLEALCEKHEAGSSQLTGGFSALAVKHPQATPLIRQATLPSGRRF